MSALSGRPLAERAPRVLLDLDFSQDELSVNSDQSATATTQAFSSDDFRDFTLEAELGLLEGAERDRYGLYFRQSAEERYAACTINGLGHLSIGLVDNGPALVVAEGTLDQVPGFQRGVGAINRLGVVVCGQVAACVVNGVAVAGVVLDARYTTGKIGALVVHTSEAPRARVAVRWAQARALFPDPS